MHERICQWIDTDYIAEQRDYYDKILSHSACCHLTALEYVDKKNPIEGIVQFIDYREYPCTAIGSLTTYSEGRPSYRSGALLFQLAKHHPDGTSTPFEALVVSGWLNDDNISVEMVTIACVPKAYIAEWLAFEKECARVARSAIQFRNKVYIIGGTDVAFEANVQWEDIHLPKALKDGILQDVAAFFGKGVSIYQRLNINPFRKILLAGLPGTGKTMLCSALARWAQTQNYFVIYVSGSNRYGAQFWKIHQALDMAADSDSPTIVIVEELDAYLDEESKAQLLNVLDGSETPINPKGTVLLATTNHPEIIDNRVMKRPGRLDRIFIIPELNDANDVEQMLRRYLGDQWDDQHMTVIPALLGKPGAFIREVALHALTMAAYQNIDNLPLEVLQNSLETLASQIEANEDFLTAHKQRPMGLGVNRNMPFSPLKDSFKRKRQ